jgi:hypothetical protein
MPYDPFPDLQYMTNFPMSFEWLADKALKILNFSPHGAAYKYVAEAFAAGAAVLISREDNSGFSDAKDAALELAAKATNKNEIQVLYFYSKAGAVLFPEYRDHINQQTLTEEALVTFNQYLAAHYLSHYFDEQDFANVEWALQNMELSKDNFECLGGVMEWLQDIGGNRDLAEKVFVEAIADISKALPIEELWYIAMNYSERYTDLFIAQQLALWFIGDAERYPAYLELCNTSKIEKPVSAWAKQELARLDQST